MYAKVKHLHIISYLVELYLNPFKSKEHIHTSAKSLVVYNLMFICTSSDDWAESAKNNS